MSAIHSFKIHADVDGYLDDPIMGPVNEMIYDTILEMSEPDASSNRPYPLSQPPLVLFIEAYSLMNEFAKQPHPEENFVRNHFYSVRERLFDTYAAELVLSVDFVLLSLQKSRKSRLLISAIKRAVDVDSAYFRAFERLATHLASSGFSIDDFPSSLSDDDWRTKYFALQERYAALSALYQSTVQQPPVTDANNQYRLPLDVPPTPKETSRYGIVQVKDLIELASDIEDTDLFQVLRVYFSNAKGNMVDYLDAKEKLYKAKKAAQHYSKFTLSKTFSKLDCIRVFRALVDGGKIATLNGTKLIRKDFFKALSIFLNCDFSDESTRFSSSLSDSESGTKHTAIFDELAGVIQNAFNTQ